MHTLSHIRLQMLRQKLRRRAQLRENLGRTIHAAIWIFVTVAACVWLLSL